ncbi:NADPH-dependent F420 reductase [Deinococcus sp. QL22]|uniref:NADPH-dependent F420 reductase n=1 Tax=Deinococcus sp. QL22 TaxID=2939437 RepID=UPI0020177059|nr:NAD(P)-binding domain-containing protein [Deinococcus sp. QL22]UQN09803.1 NAD(P)-binding domain-containing protein [Deinococcus sp. QL22]
MTPSSPAGSLPNSPELTFSTPITIAILGGTGRVGSGLATKLASQGHRLLLGTLNPDDAAANWSGPAVTFTDTAAAARDGQIVINATPGDTSLERLSALRSELSGKILVDVTNATQRNATSPLGDLCYPGSSLAEKLQAALPHTRVVKTLNTMMFKVMTNPQGLSSPPTAFLSGNDAGAKTTVRALLAELGWQNEQLMDLGDVTTARGTEELFLFVPYLVKTLGFVPFAVTVAH